MRASNRKSSEIAFLGWLEARQLSTVGRSGRAVHYDNAFMLFATLRLIGGGGKERTKILLLST